MNMVNQVTPYGTLTYRRSNSLDATPPASTSGGGSAASGGAGSGKNLYLDNGQLIFDSYGNYYGNNSMFQRPESDGGGYQDVSLRDSEGKRYVWGSDPTSAYHTKLISGENAPQLAPINEWGSNGFSSSGSSSGGGGGGGGNGNLKLGDNIYYNDVPQYEAVTQLSPEEQKIFNVDQQNRLLLGQTGNEQLAKVRSILNTPFNPNLPDYSPESTKQLLDLINGQTNDLSGALLDPIWKQREDDFRSRLANQGISEGSQIYSNAYRDFGDDRSRAYLSASLPYRQAAAAEVLNSAGQEIRGRQQAYQEALSTRNQPLNEIAALLSQSQVQMPQWVSTPTVALQSPDYQGMVQSNYQAQVQQANAKNAQMSQVFGGLFGLGAGLIRSDRRTKTDIRKVGQLDNGLAVYAYRYIEGGPTMIGVMADEVEAVNPEAIVKADGIMFVNYDLAVQ